MQDYMIARKDVKRVDAGADDTVIRDFRRKMEENQEEARERRSTVSVLGSVCGVLSVAVLAGGIVMFNNYSKMKDMESVLASVLPAGSELLQEYGLEEDPELVLETGTTVLPETMAAGSGETVPGSTAAGNPEAVQNGDETDPEAAGAAAGVLESTPSGKEKGKEAAAGGSGTSGEVPEGDSGEEDETAEVVHIPSMEEADEQMETVGKALEEASTYVVQEGETLYGICLRKYHDLSRVEEICELNGLDDVNKIKAGQKLILP